MPIIKSILNPKKRYLQIALNSTLEEASSIINNLPISDRIIVEAGTPIIKRYGSEGIFKIKQWYSEHLLGLEVKSLFNKSASKHFVDQNIIDAYIVADLKTMDRGETEVDIAVEGGASAAIALGAAPIETLNDFVDKCASRGLDSMIDILTFTKGKCYHNPLSVLRALKKQPTVVILHRGVDEERFNKEKQIPLYEIRRIKGNYNIMISIAGGDSIREVQRSVFNDADIVIVWKSFYQSSDQTAALAKQFLKEIK